MPSGYNKRKKNRKKKKQQVEEDTPQLRANALKQKGNACYSVGDIDQAIAFYSEAIDEDNENYKIYSNRSMCYGKMKNFTKMLEDATRCIELAPTWSKGYFRKGNALEGLTRFKDAQLEYLKAVEFDPGNPDLESAIEQVEKRLLAINFDDNKAVGGDHEQTDKFRVFLRWLLQGGCIFPKLYLKFYTSEYRAVHATVKINSEEEVLFVPHDMIMTSDLAKLSEVGQAIIKSRVELKSKHSYLAAFLLQEKENPDSKWKPYMDILPAEHVTVPLFFQEDVERELQGSIALKKMKDRVDSLQAEYDNICENVPQFKRFPHKDFVWARLVVITRIFGMVIDGIKTDGLVPMADMLNHKRPRETKWTYDQKKGGFVITALKNIGSDMEVFDSYGRKCNSRFFVNYGFSLEENADNEALMVFTLLPTYSNYPLKVMFLGGDSNEEEGLVKGFQIPMNYKETKVKECFSFLRVMHAHDKEMLILSEQGAEDMPPLSIRNEQLSLLALSKAAKVSLEKFDHSLEHDNALLADEENYRRLSNKRNIVLMRRGEKEVLTFYVNLAKICIPLLRMQWKDLKKEVASKYRDNGDNNPLSSYINSVVVHLVKRH